MHLRYRRLLPQLCHRDIFLLQPMGFGAEGRWKPSAVNPCFRISRYLPGAPRDAFAVTFFNGKSFGGFLKEGYRATPKSFRFIGFAWICHDQSSILRHPPFYETSICKWTMLDYRRVWRIGWPWMFRELRNQGWGEANGKLEEVTMGVCLCIFILLVAYHIHIPLKAYSRRFELIWSAYSDPDGKFPSVCQLLRMQAQ